MYDALWMIIELAANLFESFLCIHFIISSFDRKCRILSLKVTYIVGTISMAAIVTFLNLTTEYEGLLGLIYTVFHITFSVFFLRGTFLKKVFISIITNICLISTAAVSGNILSAIFKNNPMKMYTEHSFERFVFMVVGIALLAYILAIAKRFTSGNKESLKIKEWIFILSVLVISFFIVAVFQIIMLDEEINRERLTFIMIGELGIVLINILCLYITSNLNETHKREEQLLLDKKRNEYNQQYAENIKEQYEQTRRLRHDMKQYASTMQMLIKDGKYSDAESLAKKQAENLSKIETVINVDNDFLNAILNSKLSFAKAKGISVLCSVENNITGVDDIDLCNLIGNLLDNGIRAAEKCDPDLQSIEINISSTESKLMIVVKNSIHESVLKDNPKLKSTKKDSDEHGFGIKTIRYIAEKYNGSFDYYEEGLTFISRVRMQKENN